MKLKVIGSSSKGNGYALIADDEILLIEAGCKLIEVKKAIDWQIGKVVGCLVSHRHGDHAAHIKEYMKNCLSSRRPLKLLIIRLFHLISIAFP